MALGDAAPLGSSPRPMAAITWEMAPRLGIAGPRPVLRLTTSVANWLMSWDLWRIRLGMPQVSHFGVLRQARRNSKDPTTQDSPLSVSLPAVVDVGHHDVARLIEAEKDAPLAYTQAIPAFQRTLQRSNVAKTGGSESFHGAEDTFRLGAVHAIDLALSGRPINQEPLHRPSRCLISL